MAIMDFVTVDALGRILLPKRLREELHLKPGSRLLAAQVNGKLVLQEIDLKAWAKELAKEYEGIDIVAASKASREAANREAEEYIRRIRSGHEHPGWRGPASAQPHRKLPARRRTPE